MAEIATVCIYIRDGVCVYVCLWVSRLLAKQWKLMAYRVNAAVLGKKIITEHFNETLHC